MRALTDEEQKRFDEGQAFCIRVGLRPMTKANFIKITDSFNASKNINHSLKSFHNAMEAVNEILDIERELMSDEIDLGDSVTDSVTGFKGVVVSLQTHLNKETTAEVQPVCKKTNVNYLPKAEWFQIDRLEK